MKRRNVNHIMILLLMGSCAIKGMENPQQHLVKKEKDLSTLIQQKVAACTLSKLTFNENEKILHIGFCCEDLIKKKSKCLQASCINMETLQLLDTPTVGYDKVLSFMNWDVIKNPQEMFNNAVRVLKNNGQMCVVLPYSYGIDNYWSVFCKTLVSDKWKDKHNKENLINLYDFDAIIPLLEQAGFNAGHKQIVNKPFIFHTKEKLTVWIKSCPEQLNVIAPEDRNEFVNDLVTNYLEAHWMNRYLEASAKKKKEKIKLFLPYMIIKASKW